MSGGVTKRMRCVDCGDRINATIEQAKRHGWLACRRCAATPTPEEYAARKGRGPARSGPPDGNGITQAELGARVRALNDPSGLKASIAEICRWDKPASDNFAVPMSARAQRLLEQALGLPVGALAESNRCPHCGGTRRIV